MKISIREDENNNVRITYDQHSYEELTGSFIEECNSLIKNGFKLTGLENSRSACDSTVTVRLANFEEDDTQIVFVEFESKEYALYYSAVIPKWRARTIPWYIGGDLCVQCNDMLDDREVERDVELTLKETDVKIIDISHCSENHIETLKLMSCSNFDLIGLIEDDLSYM